MFDFFRGDKRKHYRVPQGADASLSVELAIDAKTVVKAQVLDTSVGGVGLVLDDEDGKLLTVGRPVAIAFRSERSPRALTAKARVMRISKSADGFPVHGFKFLEPELFLSQLDRSWWTYFNRRESYRVSLEKEAGFQVILMTEGAVHRSLPLHDLSPEGLGVMVPLDSAADFPLEAMFRTGFRLPRLERAMSLAARVVHATEVDEQLLVGLRFQSDGTPDYDERYRGLVEYTLRLQARTL